MSETPRPPDTETTTYSGVLVDGEWTWTPREITDEDRAEIAAREERRIKAERDQAILDATAALMEDAHEDGQPWVQPQGAHDAYPLGRTVTHNGKTWENITPANVWEPGDPNDPQTGRWWREVTDKPDPGDGPAPWAEWTDYGAGDEVTHGGAVYRCIQGHHSQPGWEPSAVPALWQLI